MSETATGGEHAEIAGIDVQSLERYAAPVLGAALIARGLRGDSVGGALLAVAGGGLLYRAVTKHPELVRSLGIGGNDHASDGADRGVGAPAYAPALTSVITIGKPADELHRLWRDPATLPRLLEGIAEVTPAGPDRTRWTFHAPLGKTWNWETRLTEDRPGERIRWESIEGAGLPSEGTIEFRPAPADRGTEMSLRFRFDPPGGAIGDAALKLARSAPNMIAGTILRRFKALAETGEIPKSRP